MSHIIVVGNEKGGSGKSTTCMHVATALVRMGFRVGALDLDVRQRSFGRYVENRRAYLEKAGLTLPSPDYRELPEIAPDQLKPGENPFDARLSAAVSALDDRQLVVVLVLGRAHLSGAGAGPRAWPERHRHRRHSGWLRAGGHGHPRADAVAGVAAARIGGDRVCHGRHGAVVCRVTVGGAPFTQIMDSAFGLVVGHRLDWLA